ncbi:MAG: DUF4446 family protein [Candidatus Nanopelagicales bacterium]|nr:DUF4446 family protein [Candidatus Nanopelagicales bacterium]
MTIDTSAMSVLVIVALVIGLVGIGIGVFAMLRLSRLHRSLALLEAAEGRETFVDVVARTIAEFHDLRDDVADLDRTLDLTRRELAQALRHVSVVRYDAFGDLGGRFSFSAAMLDDSGDGLVLTSIHGRTETRTYVKGLTNGTPDVELSPEEFEAVKLAKRGQS